METRTKFLPGVGHLLSLRSYLWGMETIDIKALTDKHKSPTPILPMRHGNSSHISSLSSPIYHFDPTYEAWKQEMLYELHRQGKNFDPTYEAWKRDRDAACQLRQFHFDPTYEAWGYTVRNWFFSSGVTPILPMRHGDGSLYTTVISAEFTPILPMRHGNCVIPSLSWNSISILRSYLWGMETHATPSLSFLHSYHSDPTYEAWKLDQPTDLALVYGHSDPTYEAWKLNYAAQLGYNGEAHSDPTYEAWKLDRKTWQIGNYQSALRSYLWGMEIFRWQERNEIYRALRSYLRGMET